MRKLVLILAAFVPLIYTESNVVRGAIILDFEELRQNDALVHEWAAGSWPAPALYSVEGFTLAGTHPVPGNSGRFRTLGTLRSDFNGSTSLFQGASEGLITLTKSDGGEFDLLSIDLTILPSLDAFNQPIDFGPFGVTFTGRQIGGATVATTFTVDNFLTPKTFSFSNFSNLSSVEWSQGGGGPTSPTHQFDNITLGAPVPEPASIAIWSGIGIAGLVAARRRMRRAV